MNVSLTNDYAFTDIFGNPSNYKYLEYFLECLFEEKCDSIKQITLEKTLPRNHRKEKRSRLDLVFFKKNELINLEMYTSFTKNSLKKSVFYIVSTLNQTLKKGDSYKKMKKVIQINFVLNLSGFELTKECQTILTNYPLTEVCVMKIIRLDLVDNVDYNNAINLKLLQFLKFIKAENYEQRKEIAKGCEILMEFNEVVENYFNDPDFLKNFDFNKNREEIKYHDGLDDGLAKGITIGKSEGKLEGQKQMVKNMLTKNYKINEIMDITGLTLKEIENLK